MSEDASELIQINGFHLTTSKKESEKMKLKDQDIITLTILISIIFVVLLFRFKDRTVDYRDKEEYQFQIDINQAEKTDFMLITGIGPALAQKIIDCRQELGGFKSLEDLKKVHGIGPTTFLRILPFIKIDQEKIKEQPSPGPVSGPLENL